MKAGWNAVKLGELVQISSSLVDPRRDEFGDLPHVGAGNMTTESDVLVDIKSAREEQLISGKFLFEPGTVLYSKIRPYLKKVARPQFRGLCSADVYPLTPKSEHLDPDFLFYLLLSEPFTEYAIAGSDRAGMPKVNRPHLFAFSVCLPPLVEQRRIVAVLDEAFEGLARARENAEANLQNARELYRTIVDNALVGNRKGRIARMGDHIDLLTGFAFKSSGYSNERTDVRLVRGDNIVQGAFRWDDVKRWPVTDLRGYEKYALSLHDVLIAMDRTWVKAGIKYATVDDDALPSFLVQRVARLRAKESLIPEYLAYVIGSRSFETYVLSIQTGLGVPHISGGQIEAFKMLLPSVTDQRATVATLRSAHDETRQLIDEHALRLNDLNELRQALLQKAFAGELT